MHSNRKSNKIKFFVDVASAVIEEMESEEEEPMVTIGNTKVPYHEVTDEMVNRMTAAEKAAYIQLGQEIYEDMYE